MVMSPIPPSELSAESRSVVPAIASSVVTNSPGPIKSAQRTDSSSSTAVADGSKPAEEKIGEPQLNQQLRNDKGAQLRAERDWIEQELRDNNRLIEEAEREKSV